MKTMQDKSELVDRIKKHLEECGGEFEYEDDYACWNGYEWCCEKGVFTEKGVTRFIHTSAEFTETYDEIDFEILQECYEYRVI